MPTYEYACTSCGNHKEVFQSFSEDPLTECEICGGRLRKVFHAVGVLFKGSGFYSTDARTKKKDSSRDGSRSDSATKEKKASGGESGTSSKSSESSKKSSPDKAASGGSPHE